MRETQTAIRHFEETVLRAKYTEKIVLRYSVLYEPSTSIAPKEKQFQLFRKRNSR